MRESYRPIEQREYKARVVFGGHRITTNDGTPAVQLFQAVGSGPNTMGTARLAMCCGAMRGWTTTVRDAEQAYIQSRIDGEDRP